VAKADSKEQRQASGAPGLVGDNKKHSKKHHEQEKEQRRKGKEEGEEKPHKSQKGTGRFSKEKPFLDG